MDNIRFNKVLPSLSSAPKVKAVDHKGRDSRKNSFKEAFKEKKKKKRKRKDAQHMGASDSSAATGRKQHVKPTSKHDIDKSEKSIKTQPGRRIDIRV